MKVKGVNIKKGDIIHGFHGSSPGYWRIERLRPFQVTAYQQGKKWNILINPSQWVERLLVERLSHEKS